LKVDRRLARHDQAAYLLIVLDVRRDLDDGEIAIDNGPRLVSKENGEVTRLTVPAAVARAKNMVLVGPAAAAPRPLAARQVDENGERTDIPPSTTSV
jgi:hypothetical protein